MKILIYSKNFLPRTGGVQTVVSELARGLAEKGRSDRSEKIEVTVATQTPGHGDDNRTAPFRIVRTPTVFKLAGLMREADVVHIAGPTILPMALALMCGRPTVVEHHGFQTACPNGLLFYEPTGSPCPGHFMAGRYSKCVVCNRAEAGVLQSLTMLALTPLRRWLSNRANANIMPTDWLGTILQLRRMRTVYHGISGQPVERTSDHPVAQVPHPVAEALHPVPSAARTTFAFQGRLVSTKGIKLLLRAAEQLREQQHDFQILVVGDGPERENLKAFISDELSQHVKFLGHVPENRLNEALQDAGVVVMPSLGGEVFGLVAAENMLRGKLLIVSDIGALSEVVGKTGMVFRTGDAEELATCMRSVIKEPGVAIGLGASARIRAMQAFNRDSMIEGHLILYREALSR